MNALIKLIEVTKTFRHDGRELTAVDHVSLEIKKGEIFGIIGLSGAGKSTLIRCMNRLEVPTSGDILIDGESILSMKPAQLRALRRKVTMIFQQFNLLMQKTVARNVRYPLELAHVPKAKADARVKELLEIVGLSDKADAYPSQLSGGQKQRVAIARALASDPEVLLCDEATSALDPMTTQSILSLLQDINRRLGITVVVITHEMAVIRQICTNVAILDSGRVAELGSVDEVFTHTRSEAGRRLFGFVTTHKAEEELPSIPTLQLVFDGTSATRPVIAEIVRETGIDINILSADIKPLRGQVYGQMTVSRPERGEDARRLIGALERLGVKVQEVSA